MTTIQVSNEAAKAVTIGINELEEVLQLSEGLVSTGADAVSDTIGAIDYPDCETGRDEALKSVVRFYADARHLAQRMREILAGKEAEA